MTSMRTKLQDTDVVRIYTSCQVWESLSQQLSRKTGPPWWKPWGARQNQTRNCNVTTPLQREQNRNTVIPTDDNITTKSYKNPWRKALLGVHRLNKEKDLYPSSWKKLTVSIFKVTKLIKKSHKSQGHTEHLKKTDGQVKVIEAMVRHSQTWKTSQNIVHQRLPNEVYEDPPDSTVQLSRSYVGGHVKRASETLNVADSGAVSMKF